MRTLVEENIVNGTPYTCKKYKITHSGSCQCFKDCDCSDKRGELIGYFYEYKHPLSTKKFNSLESCDKSFKAKVNNQNPELI